MEEEDEDRDGDDHRGIRREETTEGRGEKERVTETRADSSQTSSSCYSSRRLSLTTDGRRIDRIIISSDLIIGDNREQE